MIKHFTWLINLFLITLLSYISTNILVTYIKSKLESPPEIKSIVGKKEEAKEERHPAEYYKIISQRNLFNSNPPPPAPPPAPVQPPPVNAYVPPPPPPPPLNLKLIGTIASDPLNSFAIINNLKTNKQDLYKIGDHIESAILVEIHRNKVLIKRGENIETLNLIDEKDSLIGGGPSSQTKPTMANGNIRPSQPPTPFQPPSAINSSGGEIRQTGQNTWHIPRSEITNAIGNLSQLMTEALLRPHFEEGRPAGFMVAQIKPGSIFEQIGIRRGDIIKKINGASLNSPQEALELYSRLQTESMISLEVERDHQVSNFVYNIN